MTSVDEVYGSYHEGVQDLFSENNLHGVIDRVEEIDKNLKLLEEGADEVVTYFYAGVFFSVDSQNVSSRNVTIRDQSIFKKHSNNRASLEKVVCDGGVRSTVLDNIKDEESQDKIKDYFERLNDEELLQVIKGPVKYGDSVQVQDVDALPKDTVMEYNVAPRDNNRVFELGVSSNEESFDEFEFKEPNEVIKEDRLRMFIVYSDYIDELVSNVLEKTEEDLEKVSSILEDLKDDYGTRLTLSSI